VHISQDLLERIKFIEALEKSREKRIEYKSSIIAFNNRQNKAIF
tara:strand:- start:78 stop:209 length:132 start_codon:yes stop_codon:yes gene_type:complete